VSTRDPAGIHPGHPRRRRAARLRPHAPSAASVAAYRVYRLIAVALFMAFLLAAAAGAQPAVGPDAAAEHEVLERTNAIRTARGLPALAPDGQLTELARAHSCEMARENYLGHRSPVNGGLGQRIREAETPVARAGENLAWVSGDEHPVQVAVEGWLQSRPHRENLLDRRFTETGIGVCRTGQSYYFTQMFARPRQVPAG
jgi:uncharacterized protein YkwD